MPPNFQQEGIDAAKEVRKRHPGTGVVVLSQYDEPEYAISLLGEGAAGYAYLLKDRVAEGDQLARAVREVATGGSMLDPRIVEALVTPVTDSGDLTPCGGRASADGRRRAADQGNRCRAEHHARRDRGRRREALPQAGARSERRRGELAAEASDAAPARSSSARSRARR